MPPEEPDEAAVEKGGAAADGGSGERGLSSDGRGGLPMPSLPTLPAMSPSQASLVTAAQEQAGPALSTALEELADPSSRLRHRLPLLGSLSRRFGATLLRRVATRLEEDAAKPGAPPLARSVASRAAAADRSIAELLQPDAPAPP